MLASRIRAAALLGMGGALLWILNLILEWRYGLDPSQGPTTSPALLANQAGFLIAGTAILAGYLGLVLDRAGGTGRFGRVSLLVLVVAWGAEVVAMWAGIAGANLDILQPIGGLLQMIGMPLVAVAVIRGNSWHGWQRFAPIFLAAVFLLVVMVPIFAGWTPDGPPAPAEASWMAGIFVLNLALYTGGGRGARMMRPQATSDAVAQ